jgi:hypothetical protein
VTGARWRRGAAGASAVLALLLATGQPARPAETALGSARFDLPATFDDWTRREANDGLLFQRVYEPAGPRGRKGIAILLVAKPRPASGAFDTAFMQFVRGFKQVPTEGKPLTAKAGETLDGHPIRIEQRCCRSSDGLRMNAWFVGIAAGGSEHYLILLTLQLERDAEKPVREGFEALVRAYRPTRDDRGLVLAPKSGDGGMDGLYARTETRLMPNAFGGLDFTADQATLLFDKGGLFTTELPRDGDIAGHCRTEVATCGTYALKGGWLSANRIDRVEIENAFGLVTRSSDAFTRTKDGIKIGDKTYATMPPFADGHRFSGTWSHTFGSSGPTGSVGGARTLTLSPDGRFTREGSTGFSSTGGAIDGGTTVAGHSRRPVQSGRYAVSGFRITLTDDAGGAESLSLFAPDRDKDKLLVIGGANYLKQGK